MAGEKTLTISQIEGNDGVTVIDMQGGGGAGPSDFTYGASASGLPPNDPLITLQIFPSGAFDAGTDSLGQIGVLKTFTGLSDDIHYAYSSGTATFGNGVWQGNVRAILTGVTGHTIDLDIQFISPDLTTYNPSPTTPPTNPSNHDVSYDPDKDAGHVTLTFDYTNADALNPIGIAVLRNGVVVSSIPWVNGVTSYSLVDTVYTPGGGNYTYTFKAYKYSGTLVTAASSGTVVSFGGVLPDITVTGSGGLTLSGAATFVFIGDVSGIYTLTPNLTHDTLYDRTGLTTQNVAIPDPFIITAYLGK